MEFSVWLYILWIYLRPVYTCEGTRHVRVIRRNQQMPKHAQTCKSRSKKTTQLNVNLRTQVKHLIVRIYATICDYVCFLPEYRYLDNVGFMRVGIGKLELCSQTYSFVYCFSPFCVCEVLSCEQRKGTSKKFSLVHNAHESQNKSRSHEIKLVCTR